MMAWLRLGWIHTFRFRQLNPGLDIVKKTTLNRPIFLPFLYGAEGIDLLRRIDTTITITITPTTRLWRKTHAGTNRCAVAGLAAVASLSPMRTTRGAGQIMAIGTGKIP